MHAHAKYVHFHMYAALHELNMLFVYVLCGCSRARASEHRLLCLHSHEGHEGSTEVEESRGQEADIEERRGQEAEADIEERRGQEADIEESRCQEAKGPSVWESRCQETHSEVKAEAPRGGIRKTVFGLYMDAWTQQAA